MTCDPRGSRRAGPAWSAVLSAGIFLATPGCCWMPEMGPGPIGPAAWVSPGSTSPAESRALKKEVEADAFPTAAEAGL